MKQTRLLLASWAQSSSRELQLDVNALTLAVISLAGFGKPVQWSSKSEDDSKDVPRGYKLSFLRAINDTTANMIAILLLPAWLMNLTPLAKAALAHSQLDKYMRDLIRSEEMNIIKDKNHESAAARGNLLTSLLRASANEANSMPANSRKVAFTEDEVMGNLFIYLLAGYETTANAIVYGLITLALRPDIQDRVIEEIAQVYAEAAKERRAEPTYAEDFEKLQYTYGFMVQLFSKILHPILTHRPYSCSTKPSVSSPA